MVVVAELLLDVLDLLRAVLQLLLQALRLGVAFHRAYEWLKRRDPTRPVQYENARVEPTWDSNEVETIDGDTDIYVPMYPTPAKLEKYALMNELLPSALPRLLMVMMAICSMKMS